MPDGTTTIGESRHFSNSLSAGLSVISRYHRFGGGNTLQGGRGRLKNCTQEKIKGEFISIIDQLSFGSTGLDIRNTVIPTILYGSQGFLFFRGS